MTIKKKPSLRPADVLFKAINETLMKHASNVAWAISEISDLGQSGRFSATQLEGQIKQRERKIQKHEKIAQNVMNIVEELPIEAQMQFVRQFVLNFSRYGRVYDLMNDYFDKTPEAKAVLVQQKGFRRVGVMQDFINSRNIFDPNLDEVKPVFQQVMKYA